MMVLKSDDFCFNPTIQLPQFEMQQEPQPPPLPQQQQQLHERSTMKEELGSSPQPQPHLKPPTEMVKCPRCESSNTKFCYYNNYSLSQPRHFCKECRRYWTKGGSLRNVPVGGGIRKNKRTKPATTSPHQLSACHGINDLPSSMPDHYPTPLFFPFAGNDGNLTPLPRQHLPDQHSPTSAPFFDMGHPHQHHHLSSLLGLELATSVPRHLPPATSSASSFSLALDPYAALDWKSNQHKTSAGENNSQSLAAPKLEEDPCHTSSSVVDQWSTANQEGLFDNYWHTNSWLEMPTPYSTTATTLLQ